tara:strand:+ start:10543 stop:11148 length:606 start_codon:yes stop_codon:yes gene_type:complete
MAIKKLVEVWDGNHIIKKNIIFLKKKTKEVLNPQSENIEQIKKDLLDTYQATPCAGVAANQIGYNKRIFIGMKNDIEEEKKSTIIGNPNANNYEFYINPKIDQSSRKSIQEGEEGCLSIPEIRLVAERFDKIKVRYFNGDGKKIKKTLSGFISRLFQHELDHLDGKLMFDNQKIKQVYRISDNKNIDKLYAKLMDELSRFL